LTNISRHIIDRLFDYTLDWNKQEMPDAAELRITPTCGQIREVLQYIENLEETSWMYQELCE